METLRRDARLAGRSRLGSLVVNVSFAFAHRYKIVVWEMYVGLAGGAILVGGLLTREA